MLLLAVGTLARLGRARREVSWRQVEERDRRLRVLDAMIEGTEVQLAYLDTDLRFVWMNAAYALGRGVAREDTVGRRFAEVFPAARDLQLWLERARDTAEPVRLRAIPQRIEHRPKRGRRHLDVAFLPQKDASGALEGIVLSAIDVSLRVQARDQLVAAEHARTVLAETLRDEVSHRVKNNLAMAAGLLQMQSVEEQDPRVAALFRDHASRLRTLAQVHDQLQASPEGRLDLLAGIRRLAEAILQAPAMGGLDFAIEGDPVDVPPRAATNLLIAANELITNAAKHGAPAGRGSGDVRVDVRIGLRMHGGRLILSVWNSGDPVPADFDASRATGTGLRLVRALIVDQYGGAFSLRPHEGGTLAEARVDQDRIGIGGA